MSKLLNREAKSSALLVGARVYCCNNFSGSIFNGVLDSIGLNRFVGFWGGVEGSGSESVCGGVEGSGSDSFCEMSTAHQLVQQTELQMLVTQTESTGLVLKAQELEVIELV